jgi:hypothetical protein
MLNRWFPLSFYQTGIGERFYSFYYRSMWSLYGVCEPIWACIYDSDAEKTGRPRIWEMFP